VKNLSEIVPAEHASAATRWEMPLFANQQEPDLTAVGAQLRTAEHLDALEQSAYQEGLQRGHAEGYAAGMAAAQAQAQRLASMLECLSHPFKELSTEVEHALIQLVADTARKLVNAELDLDPAKTAGAVQEALAALATAPRELRVHVHAEDAQLLRETLTLNTEVEWKLVPDAKLQRGDCVLVTDTGRVDARLERRLGGITRGLLGEDA